MIGKLGEETGPVDTYDELIVRYRKGIGLNTGVVTKSEFGYLISSYEPFYAYSDPDRAVGWVGVDIEMSVLLDEIRIQTVQIVGLTIIIMIVFWIILLFFTRRHIIRPVRLLSENMSQFVENGNTLTTVRLPIPGSGDEISAMYESYGTMVNDIIEYTESLARITTEKERIATELSVAHRIQTSMMPVNFDLYPDQNVFQLYAVMQPALEVGGDFYDFFMIDKDHLES